jgi:predicted restriction endonuclease
LLSCPWNGFSKLFVRLAGSAPIHQAKKKPMEKLRQKRPRLVLNPEGYDHLRARVLERDGWRCQCCGSSTNLQVHHLIHRSQLGADELDNLMTLCADCHRREHT